MGPMALAGLSLPFSKLTFISGKAQTGILVGIELFQQQVIQQFFMQLMVKLLIQWRINPTGME